MAALSGGSGGRVSVGVISAGISRTHSSVVDENLVLSLCDFELGLAGDGCGLEQKVEMTSKNGGTKMVWRLTLWISKPQGTLSKRTGSGIGNSKSLTTSGTHSFRSSAML